MFVCYNKHSYLQRPETKLWSLCQLIYSMIAIQKMDKNILRSSFGFVCLLYWNSHSTLFDLLAWFVDISKSNIFTNVSNKTHFLAKKATSKELNFSLCINQSYIAWFAELLVEKPNTFEMLKWLILCYNSIRWSNRKSNRSIC